MTTPTPTGPTRAWQLAKVERIVSETFRVKTYTFRLPKWRPFTAGQHYDVRLTAADGYQAQRSYSIASPPEREGTIDLTIELIKDGEVSPYFHNPDMCLVLRIISFVAPLLSGRDVTCSFLFT